MKRSIVLHGQQVSYELTRKPVKYVNIRVRADGSVSVSAGEWVSEGQIEAILQARALFLLRALEKFSAQADRRPVPLSYRTGELLYLLGKRYVLVLEQGEKNTVCQKETQIVLTVKEPENAALRKRVMEAFLKALCLSVTSSLCGAIQPSMAHLGVPMPEIRVRSMTSRWGSCTPGAQRVTFARQLVEVPLTCIEYVVFHELVHFLHPNHSRQFYACLEAFVPDWRERRQALNDYTYR